MFLFDIFLFIIVAAALAVAAVAAVILLTIAGVILYFASYAIAAGPYLFMELLEHNSTEKLRRNREIRHRERSLKRSKHPIDK